MSKEIDEVTHLRILIKRRDATIGQQLKIIEDLLYTIEATKARAELMQESIMEDIQNEEQSQQNNSTLLSDSR